MAFRAPQVTESYGIEVFDTPPYKQNWRISLITVSFFILKLPFFIFSFTLSMFYLLFLSIFQFTRLRKIITKLTSFICYKIIQFFTGTFAVNIQPTPLVDTYSDQMDFIPPKAGDLVISNCASYLNIFYLQSAFIPIFVFPVDEERVCVKTFFEIVLNLLLSKPLNKGKQIKKFSTVMDYAKTVAKCPVVIMPECAPTNGSTILKFQPFGIGYDLGDSRVTIVGFIHGGYSISPNFTHGNGALHFSKMLGRVYGTLKVRTALPQDIPPCPNEGINVEWIEHCRKILAKIMRVPISVKTVESFSIYYPIKEYKRHND